MVQTNLFPHLPARISGLRDLAYNLWWSWQPDARNLFRDLGLYPWRQSGHNPIRLVMDTIDRLPQTGDRGIYLKQQLKDKLVEHKHYIDEHGEDMPEIRNWKWGDPK